MPPDVIGRYEVLTTIGSGGMGSVYRARMQGPAGAAKEVALKLIHQHLAEHEDLRLMFLDEMRVAMALSHRNIVQAFDAGEIDGQYFFVMELVQGGSVRTMLDCHGGKPVPPDIALFIAREVAAALDYAHRFEPAGAGLPRGVIHRDVSPSNILLSTEGDVKLADFGVAKAAGRLYVTQVNLVRGKYKYMAPEQAGGQAGPASDLYALGAVLYEMLTGAQVRPSGTPDPTLLTRRPPPPSTARPGLPRSLDALVLACLEPEPARRPASAAELHRAIAAESFRLQVSSTAASDPHVRLQRFLRALAPGPAVSSSESAPARLARAVLAEARAVATDPELEPGIALDSAAGTLADAPTAIAPAAGGQPRAPRRRLGLLAPLALLLVSVGVIWAIASQDEELPAAEPVARPLDLGSDRPPADAAPSPDRREPDLPRVSPDLTRIAPDLRAPRAPVREPALPRPVATGTVDINAIPWARVFIDDRPRGETPLEGLRLRAGLHRIRLVSAERGLSRTYTLRVIPGGHVTRVYRLDRP